MKHKKTLAVVACLSMGLSAFAGEVTLKINKKYLNFPISHAVDRQVMKMDVNGKTDREFQIRLAPGTPDYWTFADMSAYQGKTIKITYPGDNALLQSIYQDDRIAGQDSLYKEYNRPQLHFSTRRGWINDPNGLLYYKGEYHLYYQHNPYERDWGNMHWGHAVSKDLIHWEELPVALFPDHNGTAFSGSAVIDFDNTSGFGKPGNPAMVAIYTADTDEKQVQCIAYSLDNGRTYTKYEGNPVIDSKAKWNSKDTRDPKVFWYKPNNEWVMVLNERDGHSIYTSANLKEWKYESHVTGFWECPELFELPVDGNPNDTRWVVYGASGSYMLGSFNGKEFKPEAGKYYYTTGGIYAAQTITNIPESDGRRIQIGWGRLPTPGNKPAFNNLMMIPTELTLRTTKDGVRLFSQPVKEFDQLMGKTSEWKNLTSAQADEKMKEFANADRLRIRTTIKLSHATSAGVSFNRQNLLDYDMNFNLVNGVFYSPEDRTSMEITADIIIDRTAVEVFIDGGAYSYSMLRSFSPEVKDGFRFWGNNIEVKELKVSTLNSIWE